MTENLFFIGNYRIFKISGRLYAHPDDISRLNVYSQQFDNVIIICDLIQATEEMAGWELPEKYILGARGIIGFFKDWFFGSDCSNCKPKTKKARYKSHGRPKLMDFTLGIHMSGSRYYLLGLLISKLFPWRRVFGYSSGRVSSEYFLISCDEKNSFRRCKNLVKHWLAYFLERYFCFCCDVLILSGNLGDRLQAPASKIVCFSTFTSESYGKRSTGVDDGEGPAMVSPNLSMQAAENTVHEMLKISGSDSSVLNIGYIGRFDYPKGADLFIETVLGLNRIISDSHHGEPCFCLSIVGKVDPKYKSALSELARLCPISVFGHLDAVAAKVVAASIDLLLFPSRDEGMPRAPLEVMHGGGIVIAQKTGADFYLKDRYDGFLVSEWEPSLVAAQVYEILCGYEQLTDLRDRAIQKSSDMAEYNHFVYPRALVSHLEIAK